MTDEATQANRRTQRRLILMAAGVAVAVALLIAAVAQVISRFTIPTPPPSALEAHLPDPALEKGPGLREWLAQQPDVDPGAVALVEAFHALQSMTEREGDLLRTSVLAHSVTEEALAALRRHAEAIVLLREAPLSVESALPALNPYHEKQLADLLNFHIINLFAVELLILRSEDRVREATEVGLTSALASDLLMDERLPLICYLVGMAWQDRTLRSLQGLLTEPTLTVDAAQRMAGEVEAVEAHHVDLADTILGGELEGWLTVAATAIYWPDAREATLATSDSEAFTASFRRHLRHPDLFLERTQAIAQEAAEGFRLPWWQQRSRDLFSGQWFYDVTRGDAVLLESTPNYEEAERRHEMLLAHLRLTRMAAQHRAGRPVERLADPFVAQPLSVHPRRLRSVGPDMILQRNLTNYNPTNGMHSAGDIIVDLRP